MRQFGSGTIANWRRAMMCVLTTVFACAIAACGDSQQPGGAAAEAASRSLQPADSALAAIYQRSCRNCHTIAATGSPLTGDSAAWAPRLDKGMAQLVDNVVNGFGGMPPFGLCMDCDADQFEALIRFMAAEGESP